jgi:hypothetical protein
MVPASLGLAGEPPLRGPGLGGALERRNSADPGREALFAREIDRARVAANIAERQEARADASRRLEERREGRGQETERERPERGTSERPERMRREEGRSPEPARAARSTAHETDTAEAPGEPLTRPTPEAPSRPVERPAVNSTGGDVARAEGAAPGLQARTAAQAAPAAAPAAAPDRPIAARTDMPATAAERTVRVAAGGRPEAAAAPPRADRVLEQLAAELRPGLRQALVVLDPAELGRIAIRVRMVEGGVAASLRAESPETLALIEKHLPELRAQFAAQGLALVELDVALDHRRGEGGQGGRDNGPAPARQAEAAARTARTETTGSAQATDSERPSEGLLDTLA